MPVITYTHINLWIFEHCQCQTNCCKNTKNEQIAGISKQRHQIRFRKTNRRQEKMWERTKLPNMGKIITQKPKTWRTHNAEQEKFLHGSNSELFLLSCYYVNVELGLQFFFVQSKSWGKEKHCRMREKWTFLVFSCPRNSKNVFPKVGLGPIRIFPLFQFPTPSSLGKIMPPSHLVALT